MNAPVSSVALEKPTLQLLPIAALLPSTTHVQELRRARFVEQDIKELAEDIKRNGMMHQPIVRPAAAGKYEIVTGEQRWLAAKKIGMKEIYVNVRELADDQALEMQLSENLRRNDLHELEEAEGYEELMKLRKIPAEAVADMVGRSKSYVVKRVKLLALGPDARKAFYAGELDSSTALLIARIQGHEVQKKAMKELAEQRSYGDIQNFKDAAEFIRDNYMLRLKEAPFDTKDEKLLAAAGSCLKCPKRTGNQTDLFSDVKDTDLCTDAKCFDDKKQVHFAVAARKLEAQGKTVIYGAAAKKLMPHWRENSGAYIAGGEYVSLDEYSHDLGGKVGQAMPKDFEPTILQHPGTGELIEVASKQAVTKAKLLKGKKGTSISSAGGAYNYSAATSRAKAKGPDVDQMLLERLVKLIHEKAPKELGKPYLKLIAERLLAHLNVRESELEVLATQFGWDKKAFKKGGYGYGHKFPAAAEKLDQRGLVLLLIQLVFLTDRYPNVREEVLAMFNIDEDKTRELIIEERKAAAKKAREEAIAAKETKAAKKKRPVDQVNATIDKRATKKAKAKKK
jgi:ParB/RepB/Spo0J family partition protein